jgi:hypothetical protein
MATATYKISEPKLVIPALNALVDGPKSTTELADRLALVLQPRGADAASLPSRGKDGQSRFSKMVQNLVSHQTLEKLGWAGMEVHEDGYAIRNGKLHITQAGRRAVRAFWINSN